MYWVSPTGSATWANAESETPLDGAACCSLATANTEAVAGDTVVLRGGTYDTQVKPVSSGTSGSKITFQAHTSETPTIAGLAETLFPIDFTAVSHIKVDGITVNSGELTRLFGMWYGATHNEITSCTMTDAGGYNYTQGLITSFNTSFSAIAKSEHNWVHDCTFLRYGEIGADGVDEGTIRINAGNVAGTHDDAEHNTFENNEFAYGGHDCVDIGGKFNVVRGNVFHNEEAWFQDITGGTTTNTPASGYFGNRCILMSGYGPESSASHTYHNLIESNRIGHAGTPPDDDGATGIEDAGTHTIARLNYIYANGGTGYYNKRQPVGGDSWTPPQGSLSRVFLNSLFSNGFGDASIGAGFKNGVLISAGNSTTTVDSGVTEAGGPGTLTDADKSWTPSEFEATSTEFWYASGGVGGDKLITANTETTLTFDSGLTFGPGDDYEIIKLERETTWPSDVKIIGNINYGNANELSVGSWLTSITYEGNLNTDPGFANDDVSDPTSLVLPDLSIGAGSTATDAGQSLTDVATVDTGSGTTLVVDDSFFFQDGTWGSDLSVMEGDWIAVGTVDNIAQIAAINYDTNTLTLAASITRNDGDPVWLYSDSTGTRQLYGSAPNQGAYQFSDVPVTPPNAPTDLTLTAL